MFGSWLIGFVGGFVQLVGALFTVAYTILELARSGAGQNAVTTAMTLANNGGGQNTNGPIWGMVVLGFIALAAGSFMRYLSRHTVRVRDSNK
jgi:hypothetical protein